MKTARQLLDEVRRHTLSEPVDGSVFVYYHYDAHDDAADSMLRLYLCEGAKRIDIGQNRCLMYHPLNTNTKTQDHVHFFQNGVQLYALNRDGTAHDASHGKVLHRWASGALEKHFPGFKRPPSGVIESMFDAAAMALQLVVESGANPKRLLDPRVIIATENKSTLTL